MIERPGLTTRIFFELLEDHEVRKFLEPEVLSVLDAIFGGRIASEPLRNVAVNLVDMSRLLGEDAGRQLVLSHIPHFKKAELESRIHRRIFAANTTDLTQPEVKQLRDFFGIDIDEVLSVDPPTLTSIVPDYSLFDHQRSAVKKLLPLLTQDGRRAILHFPTGVGKTRTAMHVVASFLRLNEPSVVVWLASSNELLEQALASFRDAWSCLGDRPLALATMWGSRTPDLNEFDDGFIVAGLAKAWSAVSKDDSNWAARIAPRVRLVVFDEAHQSVAHTYRRVTEELTVNYRCALLGLTATPGRTWADIDEDGILADLYEHNKVSLDVPGTNPIEYLIEEGYLAKPLFRTLLSKPGLQLSEQELTRIARTLDIPQEITHELSVSEQYLTAILGAIEELVENSHRRILVFAATVKHAKILAAILSARTLRSAVVTASTPERERGRAIREFTLDDETPMVLVNFGVLTTGFDAPKASAVVIARPTHSLVLYSQMVGRALRGPKAGGTKTCEILTVVDPSLPSFRDMAEAFLNWEDVW